MKKNNSVQLVPFTVGEFLFLNKAFKTLEIKLIGVAHRGNYSSINFMSSRFDGRMMKPIVDAFKERFNSGSLVMESRGNGQFTLVKHAPKVISFDL